MFRQILSTPEGQLQFSAALSIAIAVITGLITYFTATKSSKIDGRFKIDEINQRREESLLKSAFEERDYYRRAYIEERTEKERLHRVISDKDIKINAYLKNLELLSKVIDDNNLSLPEEYNKI